MDESHFIHRRLREGAKFVRNPGRVYRQGAETFFESKKEGLRFFGGEKKGGKDFFGEEKKGAKSFFEGKKGGRIVF